jgi:transposase InsO family protein
MNVTDMCEVFDLSRSGFYSWLRSPPSPRAREDQLILLPAIRSAFSDSRRAYGSVRIGDVLRDMGLPTSSRRIRRLMRQDRLVSKHTRRFRCTTQRGPDTSQIPDLVQREFSAPAPNRIWVGDITEFSSEVGTLYLAFILDLFSRYIAGWSLAADKTATLVITALARAVEKRDPPKGFIFHCDHGTQYGSEMFQTVLRFHGGKPSMGSVGDCFDNAVSESFVHTLKTECLSDAQLISIEYIERLLFEYIEVFYNRRRKHSTLGNMSPYEYELVKRV